MNNTPSRLLASCSMASISLTSTVAPSPSPSASLTRSRLGFASSHAVRFSRVEKPRSLAFVAMAMPSKAEELSEKISNSIKDAEELCKADETSAVCAAAWDEVEELSSTAAHRRVKAESEKDPLEKFCKDQPEADECRVYED